MLPERHRQRRHYKRHKRGLCVLLVEVDHHRTALALLESGRLSEEQALRRTELARGVADIVSDFNARWLKD